MENGLYISAYLHIDPLANVLDNYFRHDHNFSLWRVEDDQAILIGYYELERYTRIKQHRYAFDTLQNANAFINDLIKEHSVSISEIKGIWGTPNLSNIDIEAIHEKSEFKAFPLHSIAHLFSGIKSTDSKSILCLAIDQGPDNVLRSSYEYDSHYIASVFRNGRVEQPVRIQSPAPIWFELSEVLKLREGTLMALGSASMCNYNDSKSLLYELSHIELYNANKLQLLKRFIQHLFEIISFADDQMFNNMDARFSKKENRISAIVKVIQKHSIMVMRNNIEYLINHYNIHPEHYTLSITGGFALNCPTNTYLVEYFGFKGFSAPPCVSDTGISLGYAEYLFYLYNIQTTGLCHPFYGSLSNIRYADNYDCTQIVNDILCSPIVWVQGRSEVGPRALGHRSILADSRTIESKKLLNQYKQREWWRPVAPIVLEECVNDWFESSTRSPYMLQTFKAKLCTEKFAPAILHLDGTARVQTLCMQDNAMLYNVLREYYRVTRVPIICNTSLNDKGEPIIETFAQALEFAKKKGIGVVYYNGVRFDLSNLDDYSISSFELQTDCFCKNEIEREMLLREYNPHNLSSDLIQFYFDFPNICYKYSLLQDDDVKEILRRYRSFLDEGYC